MANATTAQGLLFDGPDARPVIARFDQPDSSCDGGAILLQQCDRRYGLTRALADCLSDARDPRRISHSMHDLVRQRVFGLACGYADCNDATRLIDDPMQRLLLGRDPIKGASIASQPTLSRFENALDVRSLVRLANAFADCVIERHRKRLRGRARRITIDLDPTDDQTHGAQQLSMFNAHYDGYCYLPMMCSLNFDDESDQYLYSYVLRPGDVGASFGAEQMLSRTFDKLARAFPRARVRVRLDGGFATPERSGLSRRGGRRVRRRAHRQRGAQRGRRADARARAHRERPERGVRARVRRVPLRGRELGGLSPHRHQGRGGAAGGA